VKEPTLLLLALATCGAASLYGQDSLSLAGNVASVVSGGAWTGPSGVGTYRIIVLTEGFEHVASALYIQWLQADPEQRQLVVRATRLVKELHPGFVSLGSPELRCSSKCEVAIAGTNSYSLDKGRWIIALGPPSEYSVSAK
jgi:hypothetical protein